MVLGTARLDGLRKKSVLHLILGSAAVYRCGKSFALNSALAAEGTLLAQGHFFRSLFSRAATVDKNEGFSP